MLKPQRQIRHVHTHVVRSKAVRPALAQTLIGPSEFKNHGKVCSKCGGLTVKEKGTDFYLYESYVRCLNCGGRFYYSSPVPQKIPSFPVPRQAVH